MTTTYTIDVFSTLDGLASYGDGGDWEGVGGVSRRAGAGSGTQVRSASGGSFAKRRRWTDT
jgi:hypothetical protein